MTLHDQVVRDSFPAPRNWLHNICLTRDIVWHRTSCVHTFSSKYLAQSNLFFSTSLAKNEFDGAKYMLQNVRTQKHGTEKWRLMRRQRKPCIGMKVGSKLPPQYRGT